MKEIHVEFETLYRTFYAQLCRASVNIVGDKDAAHDVVQEVFVKLYANREKWPGIVDMKAYLFRSVINASINAYKSKRKFAPVPQHLESGSGSADATVLGNEAEKKLQEALEQLPPQCKAILSLSRFEGMKNKEIAEHMGLSLKTVENQMGIALKKLRESLSGYFSGRTLTLVLVIISSLLAEFFNGTLGVTGFPGVL